MFASRSTIRGTRLAGVSAIACVAAAIAGSAVPQMALASPASLASLAQLEGLGDPVDDTQLGDIRGKFIQQGQINYFGISMVTSWQDSAGITTTARLLFSIDFAAGGNGSAPQLLVGWVRDGDPAMDVNTVHDGYSPYIVPANIGGIGGLGTQDGVTQANIIAGADNNAANNMRIAIVPSSQLAGLQMSGLSPAEHGSVVPFGDGDTLEFRVADNQIGVMLTGGEGLDSSIQAIGGDAAGVLQQTMLNTHSNMVRNSTEIIVGTGLGDTGTAARMSEAITVMRGFGF